MAAQELTWVDGARSASLPLPDRGLAYGDGLFETLLLIDGQAMYPDRHARRLARGFAVLDFPAADDLLHGVISAVGPSSPAGAAVLRVTVTRGAGPRGYRPPQACTPRWIAQLTPLAAPPEDWQSPATLHVSPVVLPTQPLLAGLKHLNRLEQVLAARAASQAGVDDAVMCNPRGEPVCAIAGNIFAVSGGQLYTPPISDSGVAGTRRSALLEDWAPALGLEVTEQALSLEDLLAAEELFITSSLLGLRAVGALGARQWHEHPVARALHRDYCARLPGPGARG